jgi:hypothetical protein
MFAGMSQYDPGSRVASPPLGVLDVPASTTLSRCRRQPLDP